MGLKVRLRGNKKKEKSMEMEKEYYLKAGEVTGIVKMVRLQKYWRKQWSIYALRRLLMGVYIRRMG